jgi:hypothetical protein
MIRELFFILLIMWANGNFSCWIYLALKSREGLMTRQEISADRVIRNTLYTAAIGKYGAFLLGIYIIYMSIPQIFG